MSDEATGDLAEDFLQVLQAEADNTIQTLESKAARGLLKWLQAEEAKDLAKQIFVWLQSEADLTNTSFGEGHFRNKLGQMFREISKEDSQSYDQLEACRRALTQCLRTLGVFTEASGSRSHELSKTKLKKEREKFSHLVVSKKKAPRNYVTKPEAEQNAKEKYEQLWRIDNKSEWAREIGCDRGMVENLKVWYDAKRRREGWRKVSTRLEGVIDPAIIEALYTSDASALGSLSDEDRDKINGMPDEDRTELIDLLIEQARDVVT